MGNDEMKYHIWLSEALGAGNIRGVKALEYFGTARRIYNASKEERLAAGIFSKSDITRLSNTPLSKALEILSDCKSSGIDIIPLGDKRYPVTLSAMDNPPLLLYVKGRLPDFENLPSVAVVGPRKISDYGKKAAFSLSFRLARSGFIVVSGGALGCDTYVHAGALKTNGITVLVMGCGILADYLPQSRKMREAVTVNGCIISEYSPKTTATRFSFPIRNRIMAGLSLGTVVIEAPEKSGSLITARHANDQGRDVFVIPGSNGDLQYKGSNALLRDGAKPLIDLSDVFGEYIKRFPDKINIERAYDTKILERDEPTLSAIKPTEQKLQKNISKKFNESLSKEAKIVYNCIDRQKFLPEEIQNTSLSSTKLLSALTELEMEFLIKAVPGGMYELCE